MPWYMHWSPPSDGNLRQLLTIESSVCASSEPCTTLSHTDACHIQRAHAWTQMDCPQASSRGLQCPSQWRSCASYHLKANFASVCHRLRPQRPHPSSSKSVRYTCWPTLWLLAAVLSLSYRWAGCSHTVQPRRSTWAPSWTPSPCRAIRCQTT